MDLVIELEEPPERLEALHEAWRRLTRCITIEDVRGLGDIRKLFMPWSGPLSPYKVRKCLEIINEVPENRERLLATMRR